MAINVQFRISFEAGQYGWEELYYSRQPNDIAEAKTIADDLCSKRADILAEKCSILGVTYSDMNKDLDSRILVSDKWGTKSFVNEYADKPWTTALCRLRNSDGTARRSLMVRGMYDVGFIAEGAENPQSGRKLKAIQAFIDYLIAKKFCINAIDKGTNNLEKKITAIVVAGTPPYFKVTSTGHGLQNGDLVRIRAARGTDINGVNGVHTVFDKTNDDFVLHVTPPASSCNYLGKGLIRLQTKVLQEIASGEFIRDSSRQTGRGNFLKVSGARRRRA